MGLKKQKKKEKRSGWKRHILKSSQILIIWVYERDDGKTGLRINSIKNHDAEQQKLPSAAFPLGGKKRDVLRPQLWCSGYNY